MLGFPGRNGDRQIFVQRIRKSEKRRKNHGRSIREKSGKISLAPFGYHGTCDAKLFNFWLEKFLVPLLKPGQIVIMDNASIHKTNTTQSIINKAGCKLLFLPPYSPDLNPIEHLWSNLKRKLRNILHKFSSLQDALCACFS